MVEQIHAEYLDAGADLIETNTFSATTIGLHDFLFAGEPTGARKDQEFFQRVVDDGDFRDLVREINLTAAQLARAAADRSTNETNTSPFRRRSDWSPSRDRFYFARCKRSRLFARFRSINCARPTPIRSKALVEGGVDLLIVETIFDTLNAKAALFAISECLCEARQPGCHSWFLERSRTSRAARLAAKQSKHF